MVTTNKNWFPIIYVFLEASHAIRIYVSTMSNDDTDQDQTFQEQKSLKGFRTHRVLLLFFICRSRDASAAALPATGPGQ